MSSLPHNAHRKERVRSGNPEAGYMLVAVLFLVALILIMLAVAAPRVAQSIQRDRELELVHRGEQYKRAIKLYYRKFGSYPGSVDQLVNTNNLRFLRKRYTNPMTGKDDWKLIHFGEAHVKVMGLFGQPVSNGGNSTTAGSSVLGGTGAGGVSGATGAGGLGTTGTPGGITTGSGTGFGTGSGITPTGTTGAPTSGTGGSTTGSSSFGSEGSTGSPTSGTGSGNTNPTFGGGPIVGVKIANTKASIKEYKQQKHYNEWEFVYDPLEDQLQAGTMFGGAGQNLNGVGNGTTNPTSPTNGFGGTGFGNPGTGFGGTSPSPTPTPTPTPTPSPQQ